MTHGTWDVLLALSERAQNQQDWVAAEKHLLRALEVVKAEYGEEHANTAVTMVHLGDLFDAQSRYVEAEQAYRKALDIYESRAGRLGNGAAVALVLRCLGELALKRGNSQEARQYFGRARKMLLDCPDLTE